MTESPEDTKEQPDLIERLRAEISALASAPIVLTVAAIAAIAAIWGAVHWSYAAMLSSKDTRIAFLERRVAEYSDSFGGASPAEAARRIEAAEIELKTLRVRMQPRRLTPVQRDAIVDRSRLPSGAKPNPVVVVIEEDCGDCAVFGANLVDALLASGGWTVSTVFVKQVPDRPRNGLGIRVAEPTRPPPEAVTLQRSLRSANLPFLMVSGGPASTVELLVTERMP